MLGCLRLVCLFLVPCLLVARILSTCPLSACCLSLVCLSTCPSTKLFEELVEHGTVNVAHLVFLLGVLADAV